MPLTVNGLKEQFVELASVSDSVLAPHLEAAKRISDIDPFLTYYCAAHLYTLSVQGSQQGEVVSETVGPISKTYKIQAETGGESFFTKTEYGRVFLVLQDRNIATKLTGTVA